MAIAAGALMISAVLPSPVNLQTAMDVLRKAAIEMGCPADRVRVSANVSYPLTEVHVKCAPEPK